MCLIIFIELKKAKLIELNREKKGYQNDTKAAIFDSLLIQKLKGIQQDIIVSYFCDNTQLLFKGLLS